MKAMKRVHRTMLVSQCRGVKRVQRFSLIETRLPKWVTDDGVIGNDTSILVPGSVEIITQTILNINNVKVKPGEICTTSDSQEFPVRNKYNI